MAWYPMLRKWRYRVSINARTHSMCCTNKNKDHYNSHVKYFFNLISPGIRESYLPSKTTPLFVKSYKRVIGKRMFFLLLKKATVSDEIRTQSKFFN